MDEKSWKKDFSSVTATLNESIEEMQEIASQLYNWNWIDTTGGSMSIRLPQSSNLFALTPTHSGFRRWKLTEDGLVVLNYDLELSPTSTSRYYAHPSAIVHAFIFKEFPQVGSIIHAHSPYSLAFSVGCKPIIPVTLHSQILGEVPCLLSDADEWKNRSTSTVNEREHQITTGVVGYTYAMDHFKKLLEVILGKFRPREQELKRHGLAFTVYKHGIFVMARTLSEAFDNLIRVERNAQVQFLSNKLNSV
jgi:ribulose-5-phosphate 4-epimerase/fuculose-1-phosphate aldolase